MEVVDKAKLFPEPMEVLRKRSQRCDSIILLKSCFLPAFLFALLSWYFLTTPMEHWVWNLGQYNDVILEFFPRAQTWVNISIAYREKMIVLFACFAVLLVFSFLYLFLLFIKNWQVLVVEFVPVKAVKCKGSALIVFGGIIMCSFLMLYFSLGSYLKGSETFLTSIPYDNLSHIYNIYSVSKTWNTTFGFILFFAVSISASVFGCWALLGNIGLWRYCNKLHQFELKGNYSVTIGVNKKN